MTTKLWTDKTRVSWILYDFANSAYVLMIPAVAYSVYFRTRVFGESAKADLAWGLAISGSILLAGLASPLIGAVADMYGWRRGLFRIFTLGAIFFTALLTTVGPNDRLSAVVLFFLANSFYAVAVLLYDSYLKVIAPSQVAGWVSGLGWGTGYVGGIVCFVLTYAFFAPGIGEGEAWRYRLGFLVVAVFYLVFAVPAIKYLPANEPSRQVGKVSDCVEDGWSRICATLSSWREHREVFKFLLAFYFLVDAITTVIYFTAIYARTTFGLDVRQILMLTLAVQLVGFPATLLFGYLGDRWGVKRFLLVSIAIWYLVLGIMIIADRLWMYYLMAVVMGLVIGSTQALGRTLLTNLIPQEKTSEFFGFNSFAGKVSSTLGPILFGVVATSTGSQRWAVASLFVFLTAGLVGLLFVKVQTTKVRHYSPPAV